MSKRNQSMEGVTWKRGPESEQVLKDAIVIARKVVGLRVQDSLKKAVLHTLIWNVTVSDGKYDTRYYSKAALKAGVQRIHEHVFERAYLVNSVLENEDKLSAYFKQAVSCVVTVEEDTALTQKGVKSIGWDRYSAAGITVIDRETGKPADLDELQKTSTSQFNS